jgi:hypothetical protein
MKDVQPASFDSAINRSWTHAERGELSPADHAMLAFRQLGDRPITAVPLIPASRVQLTTYIDVNCTRVGHAPDVGAS